MIVIVAGSRSIDDPRAVETALINAAFDVDEIVSGRAIGVDRCGELVASAYGIPIRTFEANWDKYGRAAGKIRNIEMAKYADALVAVWDGKSGGTRHMIDAMKRLGKPTHVEKIAAPERQCLNNPGETDINALFE